MAVLAEPATVKYIIKTKCNFAKNIKKNLIHIHRVIFYALSFEAIMESEEKYC